MYNDFHQNKRRDEIERRRDSWIAHKWALFLVVAFISFFIYQEVRAMNEYISYPVLESEKPEFNSNEYWNDYFNAGLK